MMSSTIYVAILDDHQSIVDGYQYRLDQDPSVQVVATAAYGEELEPLLASHTVDVLLLDVNVPTSKSNPNPYPILHLIPQLLERYPKLAILVISMYLERPLITAVMKAGASGYILKDDQAIIQEVGAVIRSVAQGGIYLSPQASQQLLRNDDKTNRPQLTTRQLEVISLLAAYPELTTAHLAEKLDVANSTVRNLLSSAYLRLGVRNRAAAIAKTRRLGLITPETPTATDLDISPDG